MSVRIVRTADTACACYLWAKRKKAARAVPSENKRHKRHKRQSLTPN